MAKHNQLTAQKVRTVKEPGKYQDGNGLVLIVKNTGSKSWVFRIGFKNKRYELGLGNTKQVSLAEARTKAADIRNKVKTGIDPKVAAGSTGSADNETPTFRQVAEELWNIRRREWKTEKYAKEWMARLERHVFPTIGDLAVDEITLHQVAKALRDVWINHTETATKIREQIEGVFGLAITNKYRQDANPAVWKGNLEMLMPAPNKIHQAKNRPALPYKELPEFMKDLSYKDAVSARILELVILTGARTNEVLQASWSEFDFKNMVWTIPKDRVKTSAYMATDHRKPITPRMAKILKSLPRHEHDPDILFPTLKDKGGRFMVVDTPRIYLQDDLGYRELTVHGFRSTFKDWAVEENVGFESISEAQLGHKIANAVQAAYERGDKLNRRKDMMLSWEDYCFSAVKK